MCVGGGGGRVVAIIIIIMSSVGEALYIYLEYTKRKEVIE